MDHDLGRPTPIDQAHRLPQNHWRRVVARVVLPIGLGAAIWMRGRSNTGQGGEETAGLGLAIAVGALGLLCLAYAVGPAHWHDADRKAAQRSEIPSHRLGASWSNRVSRVFFAVSGVLILGLAVAAGIETT